jgi:hypothetical protein
MTDGIRGRRKKKKSFSTLSLGSCLVLSYHTQRPVATYNTWLFFVCWILRVSAGYAAASQLPLSINERKEIKIIVIIFPLSSSLTEMET